MSVVDVFVPAARDPVAGAAEGDDEAGGTFTVTTGALVPEVVVIVIGSDILRAVQVLAVTGPYQSLLECTE